MTWNSLRKRTESKWEGCELYSGVRGYQIQPGTKWSSGLNNAEIDALQDRFGFKFPRTYKSFLSVLNGFDRDCVNFHAETEPETYGPNCYTYPNDIELVNSLINEIKEHRKYVGKALMTEGFIGKKIEGFVPLYGHRALTVFEDKNLSPVISIVGEDVIVYGTTLEDYWNREFCLI